LKSEKTLGTRLISQCERLCRTEIEIESGSKERIPWKQSAARRRSLVVLWCGQGTRELFAVA